MQMEKYTELKEHLKNVLKTAKKLGLNVQPCGGYSMGYDINNLPPYPVGLFGALSIVEGPGARCKLGLTFDETESLEAGFNGCFTDTKNKKKKKRRNFKPDIQLLKLGAELTLNLHKPRSRGWGDGPYGTGDYFGLEPAFAAQPQKMQANPQGFYVGNTSFGDMGTITLSYSGNVAPANEEEKKKLVDEKKKHLTKMLDGIQVKDAQPAPLQQKEVAELKQQLIEQLAALPNNPALLDEIIKKTDQILKVEDQPNADGEWIANEALGAAIDWQPVEAEQDFDDIQAFAEEEE